MCYLNPCQESGKKYNSTRFFVNIFKITHSEAYFSKKLWHLAHPQIKIRPAELGKYCNTEGFKLGILVKF